MAKILGDGQRQRTQAFAELQSYYRFDDKFGPPAKGNDKGKVEGLVGYSRGYFMVSLPVADDFDTLNVQLLDGCLKRQRAVLRSQSDTIAQRLVSDRAALMPLPVTPYDHSHKQSSRVSSRALVRDRTNDYSVPTQYGHQAVLVKGTVDWVDIYLVAKLETFSIGQVDHSIGQAHHLGVLSFDAIKHLVMCAIERRPPKLDLTLYPCLPSATVGTTDERHRARPSRVGKTHTALALLLCEIFSRRYKV